MTTGSKASDVKPRKLTPVQTRMRDAVAYLKHYIETYDGQFGYLDYSDRILIDDVLYGLGVALDRDKHAGASGFDTFKAQLREHLGMARASQQPSAQWIACDERMPAIGEHVLVTDGTRVCESCIDAYDEDQWDWDCDYKNVTHWMPLPEPPHSPDTAPNGEREWYPNHEADGHETGE